LRLALLRLAGSLDSLPVKFAAANADHVKDDKNDYRRNKKHSYQDKQRSNVEIHRGEFTDND